MAIKNDLFIYCSSSFSTMMGFVAILNLGGLLIRLSDSVALGHPEVSETI